MSAIDERETMVANVTATGIPNDSAKKRKGAPSANEIFQDPVPLNSNNILNEASTPNVSSKIHVNPQKKVISSHFRFSGN